MTRDARASPRLGIRREYAADHGGPVTHQAQAAAGRLAVRGGFESAAVVRDHEAVLVLTGRQRDADLACLAVPDRIVQPPPGRCGRGGERPDGRTAAAARARREMRLDAVQGLRLRRHFLEGEHEAGVLKLDRAQAAGQGARLRDGFAGEPGNRVRLRRLRRRRVGGQPVAQRGRETGQARELLAEAVVKIGADALLLGVGDGEQPALEPAARAHVAPDERRARAAGGVEHHEKFRVPLRAVRAAAGQRAAGRFARERLAHRLGRQRVLGGKFAADQRVRRQTGVRQSAAARLGDAAVRIEPPGHDRQALHEQFQLLLAGAHVRPHFRLAEGVAHRPLEMHPVERALRQEVDRAGLPGRLVDFGPVESGQQDDRQRTAQRLGFEQQFHAGFRAERIVEEGDVMSAAAQRRDPFLVAARPFQLGREIARLLENEGEKLKSSSRSSTTSTRITGLWPVGMMD
ncbi:MAG: hypothetical protein WDM96_17775 [Lacunisphaera sp.]